MSNLYMLATPLGNTDDITVRGLHILKNTSVVACEDTRVSARLLGLLGIQEHKKFISVNEHARAHHFVKVKEALAQGSDVVYMTDAGTPGIADPGGALVAYIKKECPDVVVIPIPGPSAIIAALSIAGVHADQFVFFGFPPHKNKRNAYFRRLAEVSQEFTVVLFESTYRIKKTLAELAGVLQPRQQIIVARELTKKFETIYYTTAGTLDANAIKEKGEFALVISKA
ncbi:MAG TPA: 16S rRNA (cytidine(1402)-2'-O)-methyltransferase [Candidatus Magasanikbacteria bacterium]|nr:16S rRNA (cytidine(1402)-2'-O)-methyltransferase [Candidatus Magasanikbacteria bacterium]